MDLQDSLMQMSARIPSQLDHVKTEEATKNALIMPFINALGYNVFDPTEVVPEFVADVGVKKGEKVDYVIFHQGSPAILIECKAAGSKLSLKNASQLYRYFSVTEARFAVLTNGLDYQIYTDVEAANKMDSKPFFEFNMLTLDARIVAEIKKFAKTQFNVDEILSNASELKYLKQIRKELDAEIASPSDDLVKLLTARVYEGRITEAIRDQFSSLVKTALADLIKDRINARLQSALEGTSAAIPSAESTSDEPEDDANDDGIETTPEEIEGFHIVRAILAKKVSPERVVMRDTKSYCGVLLDDNNRKPLCRLRFNTSQKYLGLFDAEKNEERLAIESPHDIYKFEGKLLATLQRYEGEGEDLGQSS